MAADQAALAMSLRWCIHGRTAPAALEMVRALGFTHVELCGLDGAAARWWLDGEDRRGLQAVSIHAPCPDETRQGRRLPRDWLIHDDPNLRTAALEFALGTIRFARRAGVRYVVFHLGGYGLRAEYEALEAAVASGDGLEASRCRDIYVTAVGSESARRRDRLMDVVDRLLIEADGEVTVCLENRYRLDQAPNLTDVVHLLDAFDGRRLAYWHDTGHEAAQRHLGVWDDQAYEKACGALAGVHLHDCMGTDDHLPPGEGAYEFAPVLQRWRPGMPLVLEISPSANRDRVQTGRSHLQHVLNSVQTGRSDR